MQVANEASSSAGSAGGGAGGASASGGDEGAALDASGGDVLRGVGGSEGVRLDGAGGVVGSGCAKLVFFFFLFGVSGRTKSNLRLVDHADHAALAMPGGGAVVPHGAAGAGDAEDVGALARGHGLGAAEEALGAVGGGGVERGAGAVEGRLGDRVGAGVEAELDDATLGHRHVVGLHLERVLAHVDDRHAAGRRGGVAVLGRRAVARRRGRPAATAAVAVAGAGDGEEGEESRGEE